MKFLNICPIVLITINLKTTFAQTYNTSQILTENQKLARGIFRELIEINTTVNMGSTKAAVAMAARLKNAGFPQSPVSKAGSYLSHCFGPQFLHLSNLIFYLACRIQN